MKRGIIRRINHEPLPELFIADYRQQMRLDRARAPDDLFRRWFLPSTQACCPIRAVWAGAAGTELIASMYCASQAD